MKINWNIAGVILGILGVALNVVQSIADEKQLEAELNERDAKLLEEINKSK